MLQPTVFLPGLLCDAVLWRAQIDGLAALVAPFVADLTLDDGVEAMARRTLAAAPPRFALIALSMGGYVAFEMLRQAPGRIERLALIATSAAPDSPERAAERRAGIESLRLGRFRGVTDRLLPQLIHENLLHSAVAETVKAMAERVGGDAFLRQQKAILGRADSRPLLADIAVPTLVAVGDGDVLTPPGEAEDIRRRVAGARLHRFRDCGHLPALERPDETTAVLCDWLAA
ncbi:alpha/beta fold hydrolase [Sphingomonas sp. QA11]|uniref:alpha/beta fold hydrolase n=1 Tax=Sphingomonas sp. QA11 TaxID=2950605 RepID=UPI00234BA1AF|nr:alpha/beta fold hydrolase [Sphingomonas sp. QA11]WCM25783.1 alpha/beta fold hydrolase [Sphingomonas sp. QA11]